MTPVAPIAPVELETYPIDRALFCTGEDEPLTLSEAAEYLGAGVDLARRLAREGEIVPGPGGTRRVGLATYRISRRHRRTSRRAVDWLIRQLSDCPSASGLPRARRTDAIRRRYGVASYS